jgi:DNA mismatch endonuclease Vsr
MKSYGTVIENIMEKMLIDCGIVFEKHPKSILGKPDFTVLSKKIAIFCDGDFWHGFEIESNPRLNVRNNRDFWINKIKSNMERDRTVNLRLAAIGWTVLRFWEHDIKRNSKHVEEIVKDVVFNAK